jgi:hypothetical protein
VGRKRLFLALFVLLLYNVDMRTDVLLGGAPLAIIKQYIEQQKER